MNIENFRMLNLKQPWAFAIVNGFKNVENRNYHINSKIGSLEKGIWVMIVASSNKVTHKEYDEFISLLQKSGFNNVSIPDIN